MLVLLNLNRYATGAAQPGLAVNNLEKIHISVPKIDLQREFSNFAKQSDKSKLLGSTADFSIKGLSDILQYTEGRKRQES